MRHGRPLPRPAAVACTTVRNAEHVLPRVSAACWRIAEAVAKRQAGRAVPTQNALLPLRPVERAREKEAAKMQGGARAGAELNTALQRQFSAEVREFS